jgi:hypothetical protein
VKRRLHIRFDRARHVVYHLGGQFLAARPSSGIRKGDCRWSDRDDDVTGPAGSSARRDYGDYNGV